MRVQAQVSEFSYQSLDIGSRISDLHSLLGIGDWGPQKPPPIHQPEPYSLIFDRHVVAMLAHLGSMLAQLGPMLAHLGAMLAHLGAMLAHLGFMLAFLGPMLAHLDAKFAHLGAKLAPRPPTWSQDDPWMTNLAMISEKPYPHKTYKKLMF